MIKVELTKNIFNHSSGLFGLKPIQIVFSVIALIMGGLTVLWLMQYNLSTDIIGWIVFAETTVIKRATGLSESEEYRSRLVIHYSFEDKNYIFLWSSILYEAFDNEMITKIKNLLCEMRN